MINSDFMYLEDFTYTSSDGTKKDVRTLDTQYLINALAKAYRNIFELTTYIDYVVYEENIRALSDELTRRKNKIKEIVISSEVR